MNTPSCHAFDHWNHVVHAVCGRFVTRPPAHDDAFVGDIRALELGSLGIANIHTNASSIRRQRGSTGTGDDRYYFLVMQRQGVMAVDTSRQQFLLAPGELALLDSAQSFEMRPLGMIQQLSVHLSREVVDQHLPARAGRFSKLDHGSVSGRLLQALLTQLSSVDAGPGDPQGLQHGFALQQALITFLPPLLTGVDDPAQRDVRLQAQQMIDEALRAPPSPARLAEHLSVSVRQLYRQFAGGGETISRYTQRRRLERCAAELADFSRASRSIASIAYHWGFADSAHFSRAFKRHYGVSPRDYRDSRREAGSPA